MMRQDTKAELIAKKASTLSIEEKIAVVKQLQDSISKDKRAFNVEKRYQFLLPLAEKAVGHQMRPEKRDMLDVRVRMFVAYRLRYEGYFLTGIGKVMGMNHASIYYLYNKMKDMFAIPHSYKAEISQYRVFEDLIAQKNSSSV